MSLVDRENLFWLTLGLFGELPAKEELERLFDIHIDYMRRKEPPLQDPGTTQDVAALRLAEWLNDAESNGVFERVTPMLRGWRPAFEHLASASQCTFQVRLSAFRWTDTGGIDFPDDFLQVLVENGIALSLSIEARFRWES